ncbi:MAG: hypothetical protein KF768_13440 [Phycisphaeraceae bacterium]|nr:hypothetical protein [Phycisphaeraceae bacterium]
MKAKRAQHAPQTAVSIEAFIQARPAVAAAFLAADELLTAQRSPQRLIWPILIRKVESLPDEYVVANVNAWMDARRRHGERKGAPLVAWFIQTNAAGFDATKRAETKNRAETAAAAAIAAMLDYVSDDVDSDELAVIAQAIRLPTGPAALLAHIPNLAHRVRERVFSPRRIAEQVLVWADQQLARAQRTHATEAVAC